MDKQMSMSFFTDELSEVKTHKKEFLEQMNRLIPWGEWVKLVKPCYYKGERGNKPYDLELMLRIYVLQMVYNVADMAVAAEVIDSRAFSEFCGVTSSNQVPNGDTIGRFRNILIRNGMQETVCRCCEPSQNTRTYVDEGNDRRFYLDLFSVFHQEREERARSGSASGEEGESVVLWV